jgi:hypothetical protein
MKKYGAELTFSTDRGFRFVVFLLLLKISRWVCLIGSSRFSSSGAQVEMVWLMI